VIDERPALPCALLIVDAISDFDFPGGDRLLRAARRVAPRIALLKRRMKGFGAAVVFANDNPGRWRSDFRGLVERCGAEGCPGAPIVAALAPEPDDYFVLKPKHSPFFDTPLALLLQDLGVQTLVIAGFAGDGCVLTAAADAHMRDYSVFVPRDAIASQTPARNRRALALLRESLEVDTRPVARLTRRVLSARSRD